MLPMWEAEEYRRWFLESDIIKRWGGLPLHTMSKESKKRNPKKTKKTASRFKLKKRYHLNHEQILEVESRTHCEVCGVRFSKGRGPTYRNVDHCHTHDTYRGVICRNCNIALGLVNDDPKILQSLIEYINQHNKTLAPLHNE